MTGYIVDLRRVGREDLREVASVQGAYVDFDAMAVGDPAGKTIM